MIVGRGVKDVFSSGKHNLNHNRRSFCEIHRCNQSATFVQPSEDTGMRLCFSSFNTHFPSWKNTDAHSFMNPTRKKNTFLFIVLSKAKSLSQVMQCLSNGNLGWEALSGQEMSQHCSSFKWVSIQLVVPRGPCFLVTNRYNQRDY